ncbi:ATP-binding cassette domain-containing protein [Enterococcus hirae]|uniref:ATP-binding cassette domain-containing protein n=1 Tax=Enterococcus hirae TaxID=1354 RepID=UPI000DE9C5D2|nr:ATP-binding cassette domain-containing protein [Enterococcus hirae]RBT41260.1 hypothetical protein EB07_02000 [Enterococcus hirae]
MIYLNNVSKKYKDLDILLHANYRFKDGTLTCVLGNSGAGKSTLLNLIAGLDIDYDGEIEVKSIILCKILYNVLPVSH